MSETFVAPDIVPFMRYRDASAAIEWLVTTLGFEKVSVYEGEGGTIAHAVLRFGTGAIQALEPARRRGGASAAHDGDRRAVPGGGGSGRIVRAGEGGRRDDHARANGRAVRVEGVLGARSGGQRLELRDVPAGEPVSPSPSPIATIERRQTLTRVLAFRDVPFVETPARVRRGRAPGACDVNQALARSM